MQQSKNEVGYCNLQKFNFKSANHIATPKNDNVSTKNGIASKGNGNASTKNAIASKRNGIVSTKNGNVTLHRHF